MRTIKFEDWKKERKAKLAKAIEVENLLPDRLAGRRPRDPEKEEILTQLDVARRNRMIESGKLQILGPRHYRWRIGK